jgi:hypothetical protein
LHQEPVLRKPITSDSTSCKVGFVVVVVVVVVVVIVVVIIIIIIIIIIIGATALLQQRPSSVAYPRFPGSR